MWPRRTRPESSNAKAPAAPITLTAAAGRTRGQPGMKVASASIPSNQPTSAVPAASAASAMAKRPLRTRRTASFRCRATGETLLTLKKFFYRTGVGLQGQKGNTRYMRGPNEPANVTGVAGWHPGIRVSGPRVSNPVWATIRDLINAERIDARIRLSPLVTGRVIIDDLT